MNSALFEAYKFFQLIIRKNYSFRISKVNGLTNIV